MLKQRQYYTETASSYDKMHLIEGDEHERAIRFLFSWLPMLDVRTVLDVGAGTGRFQRLAADCGVDLDILGIEPVEAMREEGHRAGVPNNKLIDGDVTALSFKDDAFDLVVESGMLHHVENDQAAVREMCRVARKGVFISDDNHLGSGGVFSKIVKNIAWSVGIWDYVFWLSSKGRAYRETGYDGIWYWYTVFDSIPQISGKFPNVYLLSTNPMTTKSLRWSARTLAVLALK